MPFPNWGDIPTWLTAVGTIGVAIAAVWIALWSERRIDKRVAKAREDSEAQLRDERAHSAAQLEDERLLSRHREQLAEASLVQVTAALMSAEASGSAAAIEPGEPAECPVAVVINGGHYTITWVDARFCLGGNSIVPYWRREHFPSYAFLSGALTADLSGPLQDFDQNRLTPADAGLRFIGDVKATRFLAGAYPIVRCRRTRYR